MNPARIHQLVMKLASSSTLLRKSTRAPLQTIFVCGRSLRLVAPWLALLIAPVLGASETMISGQPPQPAAAETICALEEEGGRAVRTRDYATLERLWSESFVVNTPGNYVLTSRAAVFAVFQKNTTDLYSFYEKEIECITFSGDLAIVMGVETVVPVGAPAGHPPGQRRYTNVWRLADGAWRLIARQATMLAPHGPPVAPTS